MSGFQAILLWHDRFKALRTQSFRLETDARRSEVRVVLMCSEWLSMEEADLGFGRKDAFAVRVSDHTCVRVYSSTQPRNLKIADLQKGLVLVHNGVETVGEGTGFGLPILVYSDETYFSANSKVDVEVLGSRIRIRKEFSMDRMARNRFRNVLLENRTARDLFAFLAQKYQKHAHFRFLTIKNLTRKINVDTVFVKAEPMGTITVTYTIDGRSIWVNVNLQNIQREKLRKVFMLNEQGSTFFQEYIDSQGTRLAHEEIGAWDRITGEWASLMLPNEKLGFRLWTRKNSILRRGREFLKGSLDWVGLDYEVNPATTVFEYLIEILGE